MYAIRSYYASDMFDGRVAAIRAKLDGGGFGQLPIMSYAAKYASAFYNPFRDAIGSSGALKGDKKTVITSYSIHYTKLYDSANLARQQ